MVEEEEEEEEEEEGRIVLGRRLTGMCRVCQGGADSCFPLCFFAHPTKWRRHRTATEEIPNLQRNKNTPRPVIEPGSSATGGNINHYITADMTEARGCWESSLLAFVACVVSCGVALAHDVHGIPKRMNPCTI